MIPPMSFSVIFNHPPDFCAAVLTGAPEDEAVPLHRCIRQHERNGRDAPSTEHVAENLLLRPCGDSLPSSRCLRRERINWMNGHCRFVPSSKSECQRWSATACCGFTYACKARIVSSMALDKRGGAFWSPKNVCRCLRIGTEA